VSCSMNGAERILAHVEQRLGIKPGQTTPDGRYSLSVAECLGSCGTAPMMMVNNTYHENLTSATVDELLEGLK
jgi:NADH-quinone oxidoreductase subunit E